MRGRFESLGRFGWLGWSAGLDGLDGMDRQSAYAMKCSAAVGDSSSHRISDGERYNCLSSSSSSGRGR